MYVWPCRVFCPKHPRQNSFENKREWYSQTEFIFHPQEVVRITYFLHTLEETFWMNHFVVGALVDWLHLTKSLLYSYQLILPQTGGNKTDSTVHCTFNGFSQEEKVLLLKLAFLFKLLKRLFLSHQQTALFFQRSSFYSRSDVISHLHNLCNLPITKAAETYLWTNNISPIPWASKWLYSCSSIFLSSNLTCSEDKTKTNLLSLLKWACFLELLW